MVLRSDCFLPWSETSEGSRGGTPWQRGRLPIPPNIRPCSQSCVAGWWGFGQKHN